MLKKYVLVFVLFLALFCLSFFVISAMPITAVSAFIISYVAVFLIVFFMKKDDDKLSDFIKNLKNGNLEQDNINMLFYDANELYKLQESIKQRVVKANNQNSKIKLKNAQLQGILSSISHEFKNPIAIIKASSQTLNDSDMSENLRKNFIAKIVKNCDRIVSMIDKLKLESSQNLTPKIINFNLRSLCLEVKSELLQRYKGREILIPKDELFINADDVLIKQVLINFVENALKYSQNDIYIVFENNCLLVRDSGIGIDEFEIKLVTKKFFKSKSNIQTNSFGIGLYVVKQILKAHNFRLIIQSKLGVGSTFGFEYSPSL